MKTILSIKPKTFFKAIQIAKQSPSLRAKFALPKGTVTVTISKSSKKIPDEENWIDEFAGIWKNDKQPEKLIKTIEKNRSLYLSKKLS